MKPSPRPHLPALLRLVLRLVLVLAFALALALGPAAAARAQSVDLTRYAWQFPFVHSITNADVLIDELRDQVQRVLDAGPLAPLYISYSDQESVGYTVYQEPGRIITTLAWAYPHLPPPQQAAVRTYVNAEFDNPTNAPWGVTSYGKNRNSNFPLPRHAGAPREDHPRDRWWFERPNFGLNRPFLHTLYGVWLYGFRSGDWTAISNRWPQIKQLYNAYGNDDAYRLYGTLSVHLALARLADRFDDAPQRATATNLLQARLNDGLSFTNVETACRGIPGQEWRSPYGSYPNMYDARMNGSTYHGWMFLNLTPEIGRYLRDASASLHAHVLARHASGLATFPLWWMPKASYFNRSWTGDEGSGLVPEIIGMIAPVERWVVGSNAATLRSHLRGAPNGKGDCYWLEALVQAIEAHGTLEWIDVRTPTGPAPRLQPPQRAANGSLQLRIDGLSSLKYALESSSALSDWSPIVTNPPGNHEFIESILSAPARFYRARPVP